MHGAFGRAIFHGLAAAGEVGVRTVLDLPTSEMNTTLAVTDWDAADALCADCLHSSLAM